MLSLSPHFLGQTERSLLLFGFPYFAVQAKNVLTQTYFLSFRSWQVGTFAVGIRIFLKDVGEVVYPEIMLIKPLLRNKVLIQICLRARSFTL
jgi:hypothetical protein